MDRLTAGRTNHETFSNGFDGTEKALREAILPLLVKNGLKAGDIADAVAGMAGADHEDQVTEIRKRFLGMGIKRVLVINDGFLAVKGGTESGFGIAYNCGTGTCCDGIHPSGDMVQLGGLGEWSGDLGGGLHIALSVYQMIYDQLFLFGRTTCLTKAVMERFGLADARAFRDCVDLFSTDAAAIRAAVEIFFSAVRQGDEAALAYAHKMAQRGAQMILAAYRLLKFGEAPTQVVLTGSIHTKADSGIYTDELKELLERALPGRLSITLSDRPPVQGAVRWLRQRNDMPE